MSHLVGMGFAIVNRTPFDLKSQLASAIMSATERSHSGHMSVQWG